MSEFAWGSEGPYKMRVDIEMTPELCLFVSLVLDEVNRYERDRGRRPTHAFVSTQDWRPVLYNVTEVDLAGVRVRPDPFCPAGAVACTVDPGRLPVLDGDASGAQTVSGEAK